MFIVTNSFLLFFDIDIESYFKGIIAIIFAIIINTFLRLTKRVSIKDKLIRHGYYLGIFGFISEISRLRLKSNSSVIMTQNDSLHYDIVVESNDERIVLNSLPNKNPAKEELERIKKLIYKY